MATQNTKTFQEFVVMQEISDGEKKNVQQMIEAFSEYMVAVNSEYSYNKTYLIAYVEDFIQCQKVLKLKYQILLNEILPKLGTAGIGQGYVINIDHAWKVEKGKVKLNNTFNPDIVKRYKIQLELELVHENGFVIAEEIFIDDNYENIIDACIAEFIERRKEVIDDGTEKNKHS